MSTPKDFRSMVHFPVEETNPSDFAAFLPTPELIKQGNTETETHSGLGVTPNANISLYTPQTPKERILGRHPKPKTGFEKPNGTQIANIPSVRYGAVMNSMHMMNPQGKYDHIETDESQQNSPPEVVERPGVTPSAMSRALMDSTSCLCLIEGLNQPPTMKYPGGRTNTKHPMPRQVIVVDRSALPPGIKDENLLVQVEVLGYSRAVNDMVPIGILEPMKSLEKDEANQLIAVYEKSILRFSSHSHGQRLALRWTLFSGKQAIASLDSVPFKTITERGMQKQKRRQNKDTSYIREKLEKPARTKKWTLQEIKCLIEGIETHGEDYELILNDERFHPSRKPSCLRLKHQQILQD